MNLILTNNEIPLFFIFTLQEVRYTVGMPSDWNQSTVTTEHDQNQSAVKFLTTEHAENHLLCS